MAKLMAEGGSVVLTAREVSERIGVDTSRIRQLCIEGRFPGAVKLSNRWFIPDSGLAAYLEHPDKRRKREGGEGEAGSS